MNPLNEQQRNRFMQELELLRQSDPTYQLLNECVIGLHNEYCQQLKAKNKAAFQSYVQAEHILRRHTEYLAYRLGLQHGKDTES